MTAEKTLASLYAPQGGGWLSPFGDKNLYEILFAKAKENFKSF